MSFRNRPIALLILSTLLLGITSSLYAQAQFPHAVFDEYVESAMQKAELPGMAVGVVRDGKPVLLKGYGVRKLGDPAKVDQDTLFQIASTTKAFTAAGLAMLVDEGKLKWDAPVRAYMPAFQMYEPYVSHEISVRDLLSHRSGLGMGEGDLLLSAGTDLSSTELVQRMKYMKALWSFRSHWAYCNLCFLAAGQVIPAITGQSWQDFIRLRIFTPLEMNHTVTTLDGLRHSTNAATAHTKIDDVLKSVPWDSVDSAAPAGAIASSVNDMSKWIAAQLAHGKLPDGKTRLFSEASSQEMWSAASFIPVQPSPEPVLQRHFNEYGLGWGLWDYRGHRIVSHGGGITGMITQVVLIPDLNAGFVVLSNADANGAMAVDAVELRLLDALMGAEGRDWISFFQADWQKDKAEADAAEKQAASKRDDSRKPSLPLERYAGSYHDDWFVDVILSVEDGHLILNSPRAPRLTADLEPWQGDSFVANFREKTVPKAYVYFSLKPDGSIDSFRMAAVSPLADFSYDFQDLLFKPVSKPVKRDP
jgi:CubicO group peptidase (beta-lactamase class C family)